MTQPEDVSNSDLNDSSSELERIAAEFLESGASSIDSSQDGTPVDRLMAGVLMERYKGAFPHPDSLKKFNEVVENGAERAFALTELEQQHRHSCDNKLIDAQILSQRSLDTDRRIFLLITSLVVVGLLAVTVVLAATGAGLTAGAFGLGSIVTGIGGALWLKSRESGLSK